MNPGLVVKLRPAGPWRIGPDSGARNRVDAIYHSDSLFSAIASAMARMGSLNEWLDATARTATPAVCFSSCFPFLDEVVFVVPPRTIWPPTSPALMSARVRWKSARFVPLTVVQALLSGGKLNANHWSVDGASGCLVPAGRSGPFRTGVRWNAAVDRLSGVSERHATACTEFRPGSGLWTVVGFADDAARERWLEPVKAAFRLLADSGFGGERSRGWGRAESPEFIEGSLPEMIIEEPVKKAKAPVEAAAEPGVPDEPSPVPPLQEPPSEEPPLREPGEPLPEQEPPPAPPPATDPELPPPDPDPELPGPPFGEPEPVMAAAVRAPESLAEMRVDPAGPETQSVPHSAEIAAEGEAPVAEPPVTEVSAAGHEVQAESQPASEPYVESEAPAAEVSAAGPESQASEIAVEGEAQLAEAAEAGPESQASEIAVEGESEAVVEVSAAEVSAAEPAAQADSQPASQLAPQPYVESEAPVSEVSAAGASPEPEVQAPEAVTESYEEPAVSPQPPRTPGPVLQAHWLLSLFTPAAADAVDWGRGSYTVMARGGRVDSPSGNGELKKQIQMVAEGSVLYADGVPRGAAADVAPDGFAHPVFRAGFALSIRLPEVH